MGDFTKKLYQPNIISTGDSLLEGLDVRQSDEDIKFIRQTLEEFLGYCRTPAKVISWCFTAMAAGILGELGFKVFRWVAHLGAKVP